MADDPDRDEVNRIVDLIEDDLAKLLERGTNMDGASYLREVVGDLISKHFEPVNFGIQVTDCQVDKDTGMLRSSIRITRR